MTDDRPALDQVNLVTRDMDAAVAFYRRLGVEIPDTEPQWARQHRSVMRDDGIDFDIDSAEFASQWDQGWPRGATGVVLGFRVTGRETVDAIYADLTAAGAVGQQSPYDAFWGARYAVVTDPDGNAVGIMSAIDPARRTAGPEAG